LNVRRHSALQTYADDRFFLEMPPFLYRCPNTGKTVQGYSPDAEEVPDDIYESVTCLACRQIHLVNPTTGKIVGSDDE
jgi:hypothetical protein